jgi:hypothetical protein
MTKLRARLAKFRTSHKASLQNHWQRQAFDLAINLALLRVYPTDRQQVPARIKLLLYVNDSLFTLNPNCFNLDFGTPTPPIHPENVR